MACRTYQFFCVSWPRINLANGRFRRSPEKGAKVNNRRFETQETRDRMTRRRKFSSAVCPLGARTQQPVAVEAQGNDWGIRGKSNKQYTYVRLLLLLKCVSVQISHKNSHTYQPQPRRLQKTRMRKIKLATGTFTSWQSQPIQLRGIIVNAAPIPAHEGASLGALADTPPRASNGSKSHSMPSRR